MILAVMIPSSRQDRHLMPQADHVAFQAGEYLKYDLHFGRVHAGEAVMQIMPDMKNIGGKPHYHISIYGKSFPVFDVFYKVRDYYESYMDSKTFLSTVFIRNILEGDYTKKEYYIFDRQHSQVLSNGKYFKIAEDEQDVVSVFYFLRCVDFSQAKPGTFFPFTTFFEEDHFPLGLTYTGKTVINTDLGKIRCLTFKPKLIEGRVFKGQSDMELYVSDDKNQLPVRIQSAVYLGYVKADLVEYKNLKYPFSSKVEE